ncbi:MAG: MFS transporter, partial [Gemmatimonas sp.]
MRHSIGSVSSSAVRRQWLKPVPATVVALCTAATIIAFIDRANLSVAAIPMQAQFGWSETTKGFVLSSFFIGYILLQVVSGGLVHRFGGKRLLGVAVVWWSLCTLVTPAAATLSLTALVVVRIALGLGESAVFPACMHMVAHWVPTTHRSRAVAMITSGVSIGTVVSLPLTGWLIRGYGWPMPFYIFSVFGIVWAYFWWRRVPSGSGVEQTASASAPIPWRGLLSSRAVWAIIVSHFCHN